MFGHDSHDHSDINNTAEDNTNSTTAGSNQATVGTDFGLPTSHPTDDVPVNTNRDNPTSDTPTEPSPAIQSEDLLDIKQQALQQLTPLVDHLDQTPEEKFRTTMMMIQGSDNQSLIKEAYSAAQAIQDDKARAQALLDIVNEINYFTQHNS